MRLTASVAGAVLLTASLVSTIAAQESGQWREGSLYETPPRWLVDVPTAGTLRRGAYTIGVRFYPNGGALGNCDIGLSNRLMLGISFGAEDVISSRSPNWNPRIEFSAKFRVIDEHEYFPAVSVGFTSQGFGAWNKDFDRYTFKSRGFYAVGSRSFYFYEWTAGWHAGINYSLENDVDDDKDLNFFLGVDATFKYNLALLLEIDAALNDDRSALPSGEIYKFAGQGRGYLNLSVKWLFAENLELEALLKDLLVNRREAETITREIRLMYIDKF
ncbi:MAG TPA: hypothetical protein VN285_02920 [Candidatus Deferrimicrobium sp.]|nr:hypothetical protein [Candidatus Deferrimicrobium sp.]